MLGEQLENHGLIVKQGAIVDASIITSSRRPRKSQIVEEGRGNEGEEEEIEVITTYSDDADDAWTKKACKLFYGYKVHAATDAGHGFILGGHVTPANKSDTKELKEVVTE